MDHLWDGFAIEIKLKQQAELLTNMSDSELVRLSNSTYRIYHRILKDKETDSEKILNMPEDFFKGWAANQVLVRRCDMEGRRMYLTRLDGFCKEEDGFDGQVEATYRLMKNGLKDLTDYLLTKETADKLREKISLGCDYLSIEVPFYLSEAPFFLLEYLYKKLP